MTAQSVTEERAAFTARLIQSLHDAGWPVTPTALQRAVNQRLTDDAVTVHGVRKWLIGEAIPNQARCHALAGWLDVSPHWLRYGAGAEAGAGEGETRRGNHPPLSPADNALLADLRQLDADARQLVDKLVAVMLTSAASAPARQPRRSRERSKQNNAAASARHNGPVATAKTSQGSFTNPA